MAHAITDQLPPEASFTVSPAAGDGMVLVNVVYMKPFAREMIEAGLCLKPKNRVMMTTRVRGRIECVNYTFQTERDLEDGMAMMLKRLAQTVEFGVRDEGLE
jgi:hypothetical protein